MKGSLIGNSPWIQLFMVFLIALGSSFMVMFVGLLFSPLFMDIPWVDAVTSMNNMEEMLSNVQVQKYFQGLTSLGMFLIPGIIASRLLSRYPSSFLEINSFPNKGWLVIILVVILTLSGTVISDLLFRWSYQIPFPESLSGVKAYFDEMQSTIGEQTEIFLEMNSFFDFFQIFFLLAVLPAVCEETLFRGIIQPLFSRGFRNIHLGIIATSIVFGLMHQQFYSFLSITVLSIILGYVKHWSKSLWIPVIMHLVNNGSIIVAVYFFDVSWDEANDLSGGWDQNYFLIGLAVFAASLFGLKKWLQTHGTKFYP